MCHLVLALMNVCTMVYFCCYYYSPSVYLVTLTSLDLSRNCLAFFLCCVYFLLDVELYSGSALLVVVMAWILILLLINNYYYCYAVLECSNGVHL